MAELRAVSPCEGLLPLEIGPVRLEEVDLGVLTSLSPFGDGSEFIEALDKAHGVAMPKPGKATGKDGGRCIWFGQDEVLLAGPPPDKALGKHAAVADVSDGWATVTLTGADAVNVLARLVPVDFRDGAFKRGHTARTLVMHMSASITKIGADTFLIMVFRSMAATLVHDLKGAMEAVASRR